MEPTLVFGILGAMMSVGGIGVWAVRTEGRVNLHDTLFQEREKLAQSREEVLTERLVRIENKMDTFFNAHNGNGKL